MDRQDLSPNLHWRYFNFPNTKDENYIVLKTSFIHKKLFDNDIGLQNCGGRFYQSTARGYSFFHCVVVGVERGSKDQHPFEDMEMPLEEFVEPQL